MVHVMRNGHIRRLKNYHKRILFMYACMYIETQVWVMPLHRTAQTVVHNLSLTLFRPDTLFWGYNANSLGPLKTLQNTASELGPHCFCSKYSDKDNMHRRPLKLDLDSSNG